MTRHCDCLLVGTFGGRVESVYFTPLQEKRRVPREVGQQKASTISDCGQPEEGLEGCLFFLQLPGLDL